MRIWVLFFLLFSLFAYGQEKNKSALSYYNAGKRDKMSNRQFDNFLKAAQLAEPGSELQLKAAYQVAFLYNYADEEEKPEVIKWSLAGLSIVRQTNRNDTLAADMFFRGARAYELDYQPDSALFAYNESLKRYRIFFGENSGKVSDCYFLIGDVYGRILRDYNKAEAYHEKALTIKERLGNDELNLYMISMIYSSLSKVNLHQREFDKALAYGLRNVAFVESIDNPYYLELAYGHLADVYREIGNSSQSIELFRKAIGLNKKINSGRKNRNLSIHYFDLAETFQQAGLIDEAIKMYQTGITTFNSLTNVKETSYIRGLYRLGELYLDSDPNEAKRMFSAALLAVHKYGLDKTGFASQVNKSMGDYFSRQQNTDSSLFYYQKALIASSVGIVPSSVKDNPERSSIVLKDFAYEALVRKGNVLHQLYRQNRNRINAVDAFKSYALAEELLTLSRGELDTDESKWNYFDSNFELYEQVVSLLFDLEQHAHSDTLINKAFYYMESSKSKMLADALTESEFERPLMGSDTLMLYLGTQKRSLYYWQSQFKKLTSSASAVKTEIEQVRNLIIDIDRRIQIATSEIEKRYPSYINTKYDRHVPQLKELQDYADKKEVPVIEFFWGSQSVFALMITGDQVLFKRLGPTDSIKPRVDSLLDFLREDKHVFDQNTITNFGINSYSLYRFLLMPFSSYLNNYNSLIIIPDGPLSQFPFEILINESPKKMSVFSDFSYLLSSHTISYTFSSSYLLNQGNSELTEPKVLAYGFTGGSSSRSADNIGSSGEIAGSKAELDLLANKFPNGQFYSGSQVTEKSFKEKSPDFDFLHLAVHGYGNTDQNYSASLLFRDSVNSTEDGLLHWYELFGMHLKARLVVISSCESGIGKSYRGEGMLSMASAFSYAGCRNIVMGLWKVDDRVSVELMKHFYKNIGKGTAVDEALALAKRSYLENADELMANPKIWSSLVAYGNGNVVKKNFLLNKYFLGAVTLILLSAILFFIKKKRDTV